VLALDDLIAEVESCVESSSRAMLDLGDPVKLAGHAELQWVQRQLATLRHFLAVLLVDLQTGISPQEMGYESLDELLETVQDITRQIAQLQGRINGRLLGLGR
jgi:hypothetical protein